VTVAESRIDELRRRLERDPGSRLFAQLAEEYRKGGDHAEAIRVARAGLAQHPSYPSARLTLGRALLDSGDPAGARAELEAALRDAPDNILASRFLGQALEALGELGPALLQLQKTLKMAPGDRQLESQIVSLQTRLRAPQPGVAPAPQPASPRPAAPAPEPAEGPLPPTIRIHMPGDPGPWGRTAAAPPPLPQKLLPPTPPAPSPPVAEAPRPQEAPAAAPAPPAEPATPTEVTAAWQTSVPRLSAEPFYESDVAPTLPTAQTPEFGLVDEEAAPTLKPGAVAADETVFEPEAGPPEAAPGDGEPVLEDAGATAAPFTSSTLAELYVQQGLPERAVGVYRQLLAEEPGNERARARLAELESQLPGGDARAARRRALERTIAGLEALLAAVRRR
jgi:tetratricopeptide (TPR) repeat protein